MAGSSPTFVTPARLSVICCAAIGLGVIWLPARPPMVDLPQHGAQLGLLRDLLDGRSRWGELVRLNLLTPYLLGYCLAAPLTFVVSPLVAMKAVLTAAYIAFVWLCRSIREALTSTSQLDALFCIPFFGFAYGWGFYTYLAAAPIGLLFIRVLLTYSRSNSISAGMTAAAVGLVVLFSHGFVFLFAGAIGGVLLMVHSRGPLDLAKRSWPFAPALAVAAGLFLMAGERGIRTGADSGHTIFFGSWAERFWSVLRGALDGPAANWPAVVAMLLFALPFLGGLAIDWRRREPVAIAATTLIALVLTPSFAWSTALLYQRLPLFLLPAYAWLFTEPEATAPGLARIFAPRLTAACAVIAAAILSKHLIDGLAFADEAKDFDQVLAVAQPGQRAAMLIFDQESRAIKTKFVYLNFPAWYAAERGGFVDYSFAIVHTEMMRFLPAAVPDFPEYVALHPQFFNWSADQGWRYRYFFIRRAEPLNAAYFAGAPAPPKPIAHAGEWTLYENPTAPSIVHP
jgi:hypothetical protein